MTTTKLITAEELMLLPDNGMLQELVRGELIEMPPPGKAHGVASSRFGLAIGNYADANDTALSATTTATGWSPTPIQSALPTSLVCSGASC